MDAPRGSAGREADELQRRRQRATDVAADDVERELNDLRARAYGPEPDIEADPVGHGEVDRTRSGQCHRGAPPSAPPLLSTTARLITAPTSAPALERHRGQPNSADGGADDPGDLGLWAPGGRGGSVRRSRGAAHRSMVGAVVVVAILIYAAVWLLSPHPDASLKVDRGRAGEQ